MMEDYYRIIKSKDDWGPNPRDILTYKDYFRSLYDLGYRNPFDEVAKKSETECRNPCGEVALTKSECNMGLVLRFSKVDPHMSITKNPTKAIIAVAADEVRAMVIFGYGKDLEHELREIGTNCDDLGLQYPNKPGIYTWEGNSHWEDDDDGGEVIYDQLEIRRLNVDELAAVFQGKNPWEDILYGTEAQEVEKQAAMERCHSQEPCGERSLDGHCKSESNCPF